MPWFYDEDSRTFLGNILLRVFSSQHLQAMKNLKQIVSFQQTCSSNKYNDFFFDQTKTFPCLMSDL